MQSRSACHKERIRTPCDSKCMFAGAKIKYFSYFWCNPAGFLCTSLWARGHYELIISWHHPQTVVYVVTASRAETTNMNRGNNLARDKYEVGGTTGQHETEQMPIAIKNHQSWKIRLVSRRLWKSPPAFSHVRGTKAVQMTLEHCDYVTWPLLTDIIIWHVSLSYGGRGGAWGEKKKKNKAGPMPLIFAKCSSGQYITRKRTDRLKKRTERHQWSIV